jgi:hypothetical protein
MSLLNRRVDIHTGVTTLLEQITVVGYTIWEQTMEHCRAFSVIAMQLLHDLGVIVLRWIMMDPQTCVGNHIINGYILV